MNVKQTRDFITRSTQTCALCGKAPSVTMFRVEIADPEAFGLSDIKQRPINAFLGACGRCLCDPGVKEKLILAVRSHVEDSFTLRTLARNESGGFDPKVYGRVEQPALN